MPSEDDSSPALDDFQAALAGAILERALAAEMTDHLGYEKHDPAGHHRGNTRNGKSPKTLKGDFGELELETPRDRQATFEPKIVAKGQTRWTDKIISMYARGMTLLAFPDLICR